MKKTCYMMIPALALLTVAGCKSKNADGAADSLPAHNATKVVFEDFKDGGILELEPVEESEQKTAAKSTAPAHKAIVSAKSSTPKASASGKTETIYVESDCLNGRVWGHVTMKGDQGRGTVHDEEENTLAVTATRQGNEILATDQNGRHYVFKVKR